jgi:hypothetical protein
MRIPTGLRWPHILGCLFALAGCMEPPAAAPQEPDTAALLEEVAELDQAITVDTDGHAFMAPFELEGRELLTAVAADEQRWDAIMATAFGASYDRGLADLYRLRIVADDFSWQPVVHLLPAGTLGQAGAAYAASEQAVFIDESVAERSRAFLFLEEIGHHLDARIGQADAAGDEGAIFRRMVLGDNPTERELAALRAEDDHGTLTWHNMDLAVEYWSWGAVAACALNPLLCGAVVTGSAAVELVYPNSVTRTPAALLDWAATRPFAWANLLKEWMGDGFGDWAMRIFNVIQPLNLLPPVPTDSTFAEITGAPRARPRMG